MTYLFPPSPTVSLPIVGRAEGFPVRRVYCVGRNYADHAREMGADTREPPFFFSKPADALVPVLGESPQPVAYPPATGNLQHEVELVLAIGPGVLELGDRGQDISVPEALGAVFGYAVGFDLTRRDLQQRAKEKAHPWDMGKGFDQSGPIGPILPAEVAGHPEAGCIWLEVNGVRRQSGDLVQMSWKVAEVVANLSTYLRLAPGDLIFTGTPAGVSTVVRGDTLVGAVQGIGRIAITLV
ncbi:fumarylacetoacetate hydrolase family protein [Azovibrio restrictus]|uniref:fumarylacetoacetate hydrolase family protein n=1 Tax=Azovibrio restrictus TaxID=146938 RepID=UPI0026F30FC1|nr:fumarylacetoacetate hydrolase family protein [Azovibrio restrictus]MDD3481671.1 fumarylacetoacetate hydrolase family protein [Azovibrio restrictus]